MALDLPPLFDVFTSACKGADRQREKVRVWQGWENESDVACKKCDAIASGLVKHSIFNIISGI